MKKVQVELRERSYTIHIDHGCLDQLGQSLEGFGFSSKAALITNPTVDALYGDRARKSLQEAGFDVITAVMQDGEEYKNLDTVSSLWDQLLSHQLDRKSPVVALGGGVAGDVAGFVAATYMRGIPFIQVPTTLLAQVDSSVGGKVGIDHAEGKNLIGAFYQPRLVWIDSATLDTLDEREIRCGLAEVVKYGVIADADFFAYLEEKIEDILELKPEAMNQVIQRCCQIKADVVSRDEQEGGLRAILNFGHTIGHAFEALGGYRGLKHGEGVSIGMLSETLLAVEMDLAGRECLERQEKLLQRIGLPVKAPRMDTGRLIQLMTMDKKARQGKIHIILPKKIGEVMLPQPVEADRIQPLLEKIME